MESSVMIAPQERLDTELERRILERVQKIPAFTALNIQMEGLAEGRCVAVVPIKPEFNGIFGTYHGGLLATAADTIACFALLTQVDPDERMATTDLNIRYLAPCTTDVRVDARIIKRGRTLCPIQVDLTDMNGKTVAIAQVTYIRL
jgi:uncharacterized protein (TIGR00369 family)